MTAPTFTKNGTKATSAVKLNDSIFGLTVNDHSVLKLVYEAYLANGRDNLAVTKTRGLVSGGGKKPWKQKGTGRARVGSSRTPVWRGGGVVFGPTGEENYSKRINVKTKRKALKQALSLKSENKALRIIESFECKDGKTAEAIKLFDKINATGRILLVLNQKDELSVRATRNLKEVKLINANYLNVFDVLNADTIVISKESLDIVNRHLGESLSSDNSGKEDK